MQISSILIYTFTYVTFFLISWIGKISASQRLFNDDGIITAKPGQVIGFHGLGIICLGLVPAISLKHPLWKVLTGTEIPDSFYTFLFILLIVLIITIAYKQSRIVNVKKHGSSESYLYFSANYIIGYFVTRALFLFVYELWFRGFLLFDSIHWIGIPSAILLNVFLYVLVHIFASKKEMLACIPFGITACLLSILFNAAWPAIILHISFSLTYEYKIYQSHLYISKIVRQ